MSPKYPMVSEYIAPLKGNLSVISLALSSPILVSVIITLVGVYLLIKVVNAR